MHLFVTKQAEQEHIFEKLKSHLAINGMLWVSWHNTWSALKFTHPKKGKEYKNSHAELQSRTTHR